MAFFEQGLIAVVFIYGPILGGYLDDNYGKKEACLIMAFMGAGFTIFYTIASFIVYLRGSEEMMSLDDCVEGGLDRSRGDELKGLLRSLTDSAEKIPLIQKKKPQTFSNISGIFSTKAEEIETLDDSDQDCQPE